MSSLDHSIPEASSAPRIALYIAPGSCSLAALASLEATGAVYEVRPIRTAANEQRAAAYLAINPRGQLPALVVDDEVLTENIAILTWIAARFPEARLLPTSALQRAKAYEFLSWFATNLHVTVAQTWRGERFSEEAEVTSGLSRAGPDRMKRALDVFEVWAERAGAGWLFGNEFSAADPLSVVARRWAGRMDLELTGYPAFNKLADRAIAHPAVTRALEREAATI